MLICSVCGFTTLGVGRASFGGFTDPICPLQTGGGGRRFLRHAIVADFLLYRPYGGGFCHLAVVGAQCDVGLLRLYVSSLFRGQVPMTIRWSQLFRQV